MTPDTEQHIAVMLGTLLAIGETLRRFLKRRKGRLVLQLSLEERDTLPHSSDLCQSTRKSPADGRKTDSNDVQQQQGGRRRND